MHEIKPSAISVPRPSPENDPRRRVVLGRIYKTRANRQKITSDTEKIELVLAKLEEEEGKRVLLVREGRGGFEDVSELTDIDDVLLG